MIDYQKSLNAAQYEAASSTDPFILVVAGAGSGKTRTIVYRLAWLYEHGVDPNQMLLLTFTRKAAKEMLTRADKLLEHELLGIHGGTFHSFAFHILQMWHPEWLGDRNFTMMDSEDITEAIKICKANLNIASGDRSFPKAQNIANILSKARNKEISIENLLKQENFQLRKYATDLYNINQEYIKYRREKGLMDYDDLLFELDNLIINNPDAANYLHDRFSHILVDEYQDTNLVQARIIEKIAFDANRQRCCNVMAVGDESQSIYAFRGATVKNIIKFPDIFPDTKIIKLEENFRSTKPILECANVILNHASESFKKNLYTKQQGGAKVAVLSPTDEEHQARTVIKQINHLLEKYPPEEIAVLFRSGYQSYHIELMLNKENIPFRKYGGLKYIEAAHVKDCLAFARLLINPLDMMAFSRIAKMHRGIGPKTIEKIYGFMVNGNDKEFERAIKRNHEFAADLAFIDELRLKSQEPAVLLEAIITHFEPILQQTYLEDWPQRKQGLDEIVQMAKGYDHLDDFLADLILETAQDDQRDARGNVQLSTIHSAKGLEWDAVILIDLIVDRFPSSYAMGKKEDFEEERRLMYVACTRARKELYLYSPTIIFSRKDQSYYSAETSPFLKEIIKDLDSRVLNVCKQCTVVDNGPVERKINDIDDLDLENSSETFENLDNTDDSINITDSNEEDYDYEDDVRDNVKENIDSSDTNIDSSLDKNNVDDSDFASILNVPYDSTEDDDTNNNQQNLTNESATSSEDNIKENCENIDKDNNEDKSSTKEKVKRKRVKSEESAKSPTKEKVSKVKVKEKDKDKATVSSRSTKTTSTGKKKTLTKVQKQKITHCKHKIFGKGKIIQFYGEDKVRVNFPKYGEKTILIDYLTFED
ncbi:MAG: UvrD-helicase domain-containing protein [Desulfovibrionaceae bacterium]|nr:UvrD-helicase domain-containing protein [Desulfovibrionaceae bacterium]